MTISLESYASTSAYLIYYRLALASYSIPPLYIIRLAPTGHRPFPEIYRGYFVPITYCLESLVRYYPPGFWAVLISRTFNRLRPILAFWLGLEQSFWPFSITMVFSASVCFRYTWTLARQSPDLTTSGLPFNPASPLRLLISKVGAMLSPLHLRGGLAPHMQSVFLANEPRLPSLKQ